MITQIQVKNYQSLYSVSIKLGKFTVIFGDSDVGKSAFYRAIRGLVTAEDGDFFISKGEKRTGVSIITPTSEVVWLKPKGKSSTYHLFLDGVKKKEWNRARQLPSALVKGLKFGQINIDGDKFYPNFRGQFDPLFLLFESASKRARILGSLVSNLLLKGIKLTNVERNRVEADIRVMSALAEEYDSKLSFDWGIYEEKTKKISKQASLVMKQEQRFLDITSLLVKRQKVKDIFILSNNWLNQYTKILPSFGSYLKIAEKVEQLKPLIQKRKYLQKVSAFKIKEQISDEDIIKLGHMEIMLGELEAGQNRRASLLRDVSLQGMELARYQKELSVVDKEIKKLKKDRLVECPYCHKEFELGSEV